MWHDFHTVDGRDFLKQPNSFGLMMNVDWFQPFNTQLVLEFWPTDKSVADEPLRVPSGSTSRSPLEAGRVSMASESESPTDAWAGLW